MKHSIRKTIYTLLAFFIIAGITYVFRIPILQSFSNYLIYETPLDKADAIIVLGGDSYDRGNEAAQLYKQGWSPKIICLGGNIPTVLQALGLTYYEAEVTELNLIKNNNIPAEAIVLIKESTSTKEDGELSAQYAKKNGFKKVIIVSSKIHTKRIKKVFQPLFEQYKIQLIIKGCPSSSYSIERWWESEEGLISVNNELMKHLYYFLKY